MRKHRRLKTVRKDDRSFVRFATSESGLLGGVNFSDSQDGQEVISKKALVIIEGEHTDNSGKKHSFTKDDIEWFAEATNEFLEEGGRVPWQRDHDKKQSANIGDLENYLVARTVTPDDLPDPRLARKLVGKLGLFATELVGKGKDVVEQIRAGRIKTLSPGIDLATGIIREISATPTPAIVGMSIFSQGSAGNSALTWEEAESSDRVDESLREDYEHLTEILWNLSTNIANACDQDVAMNNRQEMFDQALQGFAERLTHLLGIDRSTDALSTGDRLEDGGGSMARHQHARGISSGNPSISAHQTQRLTLAGNLRNLAAFNQS
jgi:hypothetical protein